MHEARGAHASCTQHMCTQTEEDQTQGHCVTQGSLGMKIGTTVQVKEVTFSLFSTAIFQISSRGDNSEHKTIWLMEVMIR